MIAIFPYQNLLYLACESGNIESVKRYASQFDINGFVSIGHDYSTPLIVACRYGHVEVVKLLIELGAYVNWKTPYCNTALHTACMNNQEEIVQILLKCHNINVNYNGMHYTCLHSVCKWGYKTMCKLLLDHPKIDVTICNKYGQTAFDLAVSESRFDIIKMMIWKNADSENILDSIWKRLVEKERDDKRRVINLHLVWPHTKFPMELERMLMDMLR